MRIASWSAGRRWCKSAGAWALCLGLCLAPSCRSAPRREEAAYPKYATLGSTGRPEAAASLAENRGPELPVLPADGSVRRPDTMAIGFNAEAGLERDDAAAAALKTNQRIVARFAHAPETIFQPRAAAHTWQYIVLHHSGSEVGGLASLDRAHRQVRGWDGCGYHFVIGNGSETGDGEIEAAPRWIEQRAGLHCLDAVRPEVKDAGIGICLVGNFDRAQPSPRQVAAAHALVEYLKARYHIPADRVDTHAHFARERTGCPGRRFPRAEIIGPRHYFDFKRRSRERLAKASD